MILSEILALLGDKPPLGKIGGKCKVCGAQSDDGFKFNDLFSLSTFNLNHEFDDMSGATLSALNRYWMDAHK